MTGCGINPARSFAAAAAASDGVEGRWDDQWLFWAAPLAGAVAAALAYELLFKGRRGFEQKWSA